MSTKHTPGPWSITGDDFDWQGRIRGYCIGPTGRAAWVAEVSDKWGISGDDEQVVANADLIAAAPEMLELLRNVVKQNENLNPYERLPDSLIREIEIVIAKATGCPQTAPDPADDV